MRWLVVGKNEGEGAAFADTGGAAFLDAVKPLIALAVLSSGGFVLACVGDTLANEGNRVVKLFIPV